MPAGEDPTGIISGVSEGLGLVEGGIQLFTNMAAKKKDEAALASLKQPFFNIQSEYYQNRNQAAGLAGEGMPAASKDYLTSESQRGLGAGIGATLQGGGNINDINKLFDTYNKSIDRTASADAEERVKNIQNFWNVNKDLAGQKTTQWALNMYQPYEEKKKQLSENIAADKQNISGGANTAIGSLSALGTSLENSSLMSNLFKTGSNNLPPLEQANPLTYAQPQTNSSTGYINPTPVIGK